MFSVCVAAEENCLFQVSSPDAPYEVLGARVTPQSNYLVVDDCGKTIDEVRTDLVAPARERAQAVAEAQERAKRARAEGDELERMRDQARKLEAETQGPLESWWSWFWSWGA